jgi:hypothetical protein
VSDAIDPRPHGTAAIETGEAAPQRDVDLLEEVPPLVGIPFVSASQPLQCGPVLRGHLGIPVVPGFGAETHFTRR